MKKKKKKKLSNKNEKPKESIDLIIAIRNRDISTVKKILEENKINLNEDICGNLPIFEAICTLDLDLVKLLVEKGANLEKENKNKLTVLSIAIMSSVTSYYETLAKYIIDNTSSKHLDKPVLGSTPLIIAVCYKNKMLVEYLIKKGVSITKRDSQGNSPLHRAIIVRDEEMIKLLLKEGAYLKENNRDKVELMAYLIMNSKDIVYENIVKMLISDGLTQTKKRIENEKVISKKLVEAERKDVPKVLEEANIMREKVKKEEGNLRKKLLNKRSSRGNILLVEAVRNKKKDIAKFLVENGADVNIHDINGENAIGLVCFDEDSKDLELFEYFCKNGANLKGKYRGESIVKQAFINLNVDLIKHLYMSHINVLEELKNSNFTEFPKHAVDLIYKEIGKKEYRLCERDLPDLWLTALAVKDKNKVDILIREGRDVNEKVEGKTLLWECCFSEDFKNLDMAQFLIKHGAHININNNKEDKIVIYACQKKYIDVLDMMIANFADLNVLDKHNKTGLMYACENGNIDIVRKLLYNNVNVNLQDESGKTALMYACINGYTDIAKELINNSYIMKKDKNGYTAITYSYENNRTDILELFIEKDMGIYEKDVNGKTLLRNICLGKHGFMCDLAKLLIPKYMSNKIWAKEVISILLESCVKKENMDLVKLLLDSGVDINATDDHGKTLFIKACERNNLDLVELLYDKNVDTTIKDDKGYCGVEYACMNKNSKVLEYLVKIGLGKNLQIGGGRTLLWNFCIGKKNKRIDLAKILINYGEDVNKKDDEGKTLLWRVCEDPKTRDLYVAQFLIKNKADINAKNKEGKTLFMRACEMWDESLIKFLAKKGACVKQEVIAAANNCNKSQIEFFVANDIGLDITDNEGRSLLWALCLNYGIQDLELANRIIKSNKDYVDREDINGKTILAEACLHDSYKDMRLIKFLVDNKAKLSYNGGKNSVVMDAVKDNYADIVSYLVSRGADVNEIDKDGNSLLTYACAYGYKDIVSYLIDKGANINHKTKEGRTPLMYAVSSSQNIELVEYLIRNGAKVNARDKYNNTVLMCACAVENARMIGALVAKGAKVNVKNNEGSTPLMYVCNWETEDVCIVRYLCENGANINALDDKNKSALDIAKLRGHKNIEYYLKYRDVSMKRGNKYKFVANDKIFIKNINIFKFK